MKTREEKIKRIAFRLRKSTEDVERVYPFDVWATTVMEMLESGELAPEPADVPSDDALGEQLRKALLGDAYEHTIQYDPWATCDKTVYLDMARRAKQLLLLCRAELQQPNWREIGFAVAKQHHLNRHHTLEGYYVHSNEEASLANAAKNAAGVPQPAPEPTYEQRKEAARNHHGWIDQSKCPFPDDTVVWVLDDKFPNPYQVIRETNLTQLLKYKQDRVFASLGEIKCWCEKLPEHSQWFYFEQRADGPIMG